MMVSLTIISDDNYAPGIVNYSPREHFLPQVSLLIVILMTIMLLELSIMLLEIIYSTGITYDHHSDEEYAPGVFNYTLREHL
jgi:hypothetical protein